MQRPYFTFHKEWRDAAKDLPSEIRAEIYEAIVEYALSGEIPVGLKPIVSAVFRFVKDKIDKDAERYNALCERNRTNGAKSKGRPKGGKPKETQENPKKPKKPSGFNDESDKDNNHNGNPLNTGVLDDKQENGEKPSGLSESESSASVTPDFEKCNTKTPINTGVSEGKCNTSTVTGVTPSVTVKEVPLLPPDKETPPITPKEITPPISPQENLPPVSRVKRFVKPSVEEIRSYCDEKGYGIDAEQFWNFYESKGWVVGKSPMKSWKAAIITWLKRNHATTTTIRKPYQSEGTPSNGQLVSDTEELIQRLAAQRRNRNTEIRQR